MVTAKQVGEYLFYASFVLGGVTVIAFVTIHPIPVILLAVSAVMYLVGRTLKK